MIVNSNRCALIDRFNRSCDTVLKLLRSAKKNKNIPRHDRFLYNKGALLNESNFCWVEGSKHTSLCNTGSSCKFRVPSWNTHNKVLVNCGLIIFWLDENAIQAWYESETPNSRGNLCAILALPSPLSWYLNVHFSRPCRQRRGLLIPLLIWWVPHCAVWITQVSASGQS